MHMIPINFLETLNIIQTSILVRGSVIGDKMTLVHDTLGEGHESDSYRHIADLSCMMQNVTSGYEETPIYGAMKCV